MKASRVLRGLVPLVLSLVVLVLLARVAAPHWRELRGSLGAVRLDPCWIGLAVLLTAAQYAVVFLLWKRTLQFAGIRLSDHAVADTWVPGLLTRYIPGKIWSNGVRLAVTRRLGSPLLQVTGALVWEALLGVSSAMAFSLLVFRAWPDPLWRWSAVVMLVVGVGALALVRLAMAGHRLPGWFSRFRMGPVAPGRGKVLTLAGLDLLIWTVYGAAHWALARAVVPLPLGAYPTIAGAVTLAWAGGYLALIMPAGLGVREGLLVVLLAPSLGAVPVAIIAAGSRLISIGLDLVITAVWAWRRLSRRPSGLPPSA